MNKLGSLRAWIRLSLCEAVGSRTWNRLLAQMHNDSMTLDEFFALSPDKAQRWAGRDFPARDVFSKAAPSHDAVDSLIDRLRDNGVRVVPITDPGYPPQLLAHMGRGAPTFLFSRGEIGHLDAPTVAMVGTRSPSAQGVESARNLAAALARQGIHVVSGHACGIDVASHAGALAGGGATTLVLPSGILAFSLADELRPLAREDNILVLSQFAPQVSTDRSLPVLRNTTVAALPDGLIVIETGLVSGTSYTFREARRMRKRLWVVQYERPVPPSAIGNRSLLSCGAKAIRAREIASDDCIAKIAETIHAAHTRRRLPSWPIHDDDGTML